MLFAKILTEGQTEGEKSFFMTSSFPHRDLLTLTPLTFCHEFEEEADKC